MNTGSELVSMPSMKTAGGLVGRGSLKYTVFGSVCVCACLCVLTLLPFGESYRVLDPQNENISCKVSTV